MWTLPPADTPLRVVVRSQYPSAPNSSLLCFSNRVPSASWPVPSAIAIPAQVQAIHLPPNMIELRSKVPPALDPVLHDVFVP